MKKTTLFIASWLCMLMTFAQQVSKTNSGFNVNMTANKGEKQITFTVDDYKIIEVEVAVAMALKC